MSDPTCPSCGSSMTKRMARKGKNAGKEFWGCSDFPKCKGTRDLDDTGSTARPPVAAASVAPQTERAAQADGGATESVQTGVKRVLWTDGTLRRPGWRCQHVSLSGSLRSLPTVGNSFANTMFLARQDLPSFQPADSDTRRVVDMWTKILSRGTQPPIHPVSERQLLLAEGFGEGDLRPPRQAGDLAPRVMRPYQLELAVPNFDEIPIDPLTGSDEEQSFATWVSKSHIELVPFMTPQASFDMLLSAHGSEQTGCRRVDFLFALPDGSLTVVEIDGSQHDGQVMTDADRDAALASIGVETIRVPSSEIEKGSGSNLRKVSELVNKLGKSGRHQPIDSLAWSPVLLHRLAFAIGEALAAGFVAGSQWVISVDDPTYRLASLLGPYLEMFWALDRLWGDSTLSPQDVTVLSGGEAVCYSLVAGGRYERQEGQATEPDVHIQLDVTTPPMAELNSSPTAPTIITRTAPIGVGVSRLPSGGSSRIAARTGTNETRFALTALLRGVFAKEEFRPGQFEATAELIAGRDCCVLLPTGAGKSLIYQLAGLCLPGRTLIIDPIVSLIEDQVGGLSSHGIDRAVGITSQSTRQGRTDSLLRDVADADAYFMFVAPERLQMSNFRTALRELATTTPINLAVIDEAHCVSEWGHQFRTSYLGLGKVIRDIASDTVGNAPPLVALTGTASRAVLRDVLFQLGIKETSENSIVRPATFDRKELSYRIVRCEPDVAEASLRSVLKTLPGEFNESLPTFFGPDGERTFSGIVFVPTVNGKTNGIESTRKIVGDVCSSVGMYSGGAPKGFRADDWERIKRDHAQSFKDNQTTCLVSTKAFGMGIDKPNIRWVIHYGLSDSIESYYQEVGRAGRDGQPAQCVLILSEFDPARNSQLLAEDINLEEARTRSGSFKWNERDDVTTALFFHVNSFPGIEDESEALREAVTQLAPSDQKQRIEVPFDGNEDRQERALHRLVILGIVDDYLVEFGSKKFVVTVDSSDGERAKRHLLAFVERTQPGRVDEMRTRLNSLNLPHHDTISRCGRILIEFVYETVERSRRRSMREMLLAARHSKTDEELRSRVLEYLSEGDVGNVLEELVDLSTVDLGRWTAEWSRIMSKTDAAEWRASSARLLASYPDHPGLLLSRGLAELLDTNDGIVSAAAVDEYVLNLESALQSATPHYNVPREHVRNTIGWLLNKLAPASPAAAATISVAERYEVLAEHDRERLKRNAPDDVNSAVVHLDQTLVDLYHLIQTIPMGDAA